MCLPLLVSVTRGRGVGPPDPRSRRRSRRPGLVAVLALVLGLALGACSSGGEPEAGPTASPTPEPTAPLTGEPADADLADQPVVAVKIDNVAAARPQVGLEQADLIFEQIVEGGVTRFVAMFHSRVPERVGPVRSARLIDAELLPAFTPVLAYSGARDEVAAALRDAPIGLLTEGSAAFERDADRPGSHNLLADATALLEEGRGLPGVAPPAGPVWSFAEEPPGPAACPGEDATASPAPDPTPAASPTPPGGGCRVVDELTLGASAAVTVSWRYDQQAGRYLRSQDGAPTEVLPGGSEGPATTRQLAVTNVVALGMDVHQGGCCDTAGNPYTVTETVGSGPGLVLRDGRAYAVEWSRAGPGEHLRLTSPDGRSFPLRPGTSWVHLMPDENLPDLADLSGGS